MWGSVVITVLFAALAIMEIVVAADYTIKARLTPWIIGSLVLALSMAQVIREFSGMSTVEVTEEEAIPKRNYISMVAWLTGLAVATYLFGMPVVFPLFVLLYLKLHRWGWILAIAMAIGTLVLLYGVFERGLGIVLYRGILLE